MDSETPKPHNGKAEVRLKNRERIQNICLGRINTARILRGYRVNHLLIISIVLFLAYFHIDEHSRFEIDQLGTVAPAIIMAMMATAQAAENQNPTADSESSNTELSSKLNALDERLELNKKAGTAPPATEASVVNRPYPSSVSGTLYVLENGKLFQVDPFSQSVRRIGDFDLGNKPIALTALGSSLYILYQGSLFRVDPITGTRKPIVSYPWGRWPSMTALGDSLYIAGAGKLFAVDPSSGQVRKLSDLYLNDSPTLITTLGNTLYLSEGGKLFAVDPSSGSVRDQGDLRLASWPVSMAALEASLYLVDQKSVVQVDPLSGETRIILDRNFRYGPSSSPAVALAALADSLYLIGTKDVFGDKQRQFIEVFGKKHSRLVNEAGLFRIDPVTGIREKLLAQVLPGRAAFSSSSWPTAIVSSEALAGIR